MNTLIKNLCLVLSLCMASVGAMQSGEHKKSDSAESLPILLPAFPSVESIYSTEPWDHDPEVQNGMKQKPRMLVFVEGRDTAFIDKLQENSPREVIVVTGQPISSFNARPIKNTRAQNSEPTLIKRGSALRRLLCCCC